MGRDRHYVPGDFYRIDDRTGFPERAKRTRKEWTGLIVHKDRWEYRQPQDFVKGVFDDQTVPEPRPLPTTDPLIGPLTIQTFLTGKFAAGTQFLTVTSTAGMVSGNTIEIMLDTNQYFSTTIVGVQSATQFSISPGLTFSAGSLPSGNIVTDLGGKTTILLVSESTGAILTSESSGAELTP